MTHAADPSGMLRSALAERYRAERELARGGMATVFLARDLRHDREVAIKVLRRSSPRSSARIGPWPGSGGWRLAVVDQGDERWHAVAARAG